MSRRNKISLTTKSMCQRDLRQELIKAGLEILSESGLKGLTLRKVAAHVGVSHAAPAHHFSGLPEILGAICAAGFEDLTCYMVSRKEEASDTPRARLVAICDAYVDFAVHNPDLIQLMFNASPEKVDDAQLAKPAAAAYNELHIACLPFEPIGDTPDSTETLVWSLVHGLALLRIGGRFDNPSRETANPKFCDVLPELSLRHTEN